MNSRSARERTITASRNLTTLRLLLPLGALTVVAVLLLSAGSSAGAAGPASGVQASWGGGGGTTPSYNVLDTIPLADTVVANTTDVFAQGAVNCSNIWAITTSGNVSLYSTVPVNDSACHEGALTLAPYEIPGACLTCNTSYAPKEVPVGGHLGGGIGGLPDPKACGQQPKVNQTLYDVVNGNLYEIQDNGAVVLFVTSFTVPTVSWESMGMTYDQVGTFNHDLVITSASKGMVWTVNQTGVVTQIAELNTYIAGPAVASWSFGAYGGDVMVAEKTLGRVESISPSGVTAPVANWSKAVGVAFQWNGGGCGRGGCSFGQNHDIFFVANYSSGAIEGFPASDFRGISNLGIVAGGQDRGFAAFRPNGVTSLWDSNTARIGNINFISCFGQGGWGGWSPSAPPGSAQ
jgi:hypothetical protein